MKTCALLVTALLVLVGAAPAGAQPCRHILHDARRECQELQGLENQTRELRNQREDADFREFKRRQEREQDRQEREQERRDEQAGCSPGYHDRGYGQGCSL